MGQIAHHTLADTTADHRTEMPDVEKIRRDFPILNTIVYGHPLIYFDNAATMQKPKSVIEAISNYYLTQNANIHRGIHYLSEQATAGYEATRTKVRDFIHAQSENEIIFTGGTTDAINLVAMSFERMSLNANDEIIVSNMEHHSNIVPWQILCEQTGAKLKVIPIDEKGELILEDFEKLLSRNTKLVSLVHISNSLGTINPVKKVIELAHQYDVPVLLDGAQAVPHQPVDVQELDCDFYAFSGHKMFGPTGIGVLYGKEHLLDKMPPYRGGGEMIKSVTFSHTTYNDLPYKFEAGTPNIAGVFGLSAAIDYIAKLDYEKIQFYESLLLDYATNALADIKELRIIGRAAKKASVISFVLENIHPHDVGTVLDRTGIAVRTGHHCTQPVMDRYQIPATVRASLAIYNSREEIDHLVAALHKVISLFK